ncbi:WD repeat-containing protein 93 [Scomber japonicus]|uniref:WD repeat-containing protein 93 n=1 Tax=Scomber japonicus TaxID=13676 RepID=UPI002304ED75|nr:WD repeat-containing protein 93 [Scomber japonicus]
MEATCRLETSRNKTPTLELSSATQLPESTNCLACSEDGRYLSLGHSGGLSVWCASSLICVAEWLQDRLEMTSVQMICMAESAYLLGSVDDMGVARVFAYYSEAIHLLSVINIMEDINQRSICLTFELSKGGDYGAASISCNGAVWLDVYHFPTEAWLKELEMAVSQQDPNLSGDMKWSPAALVIKIRPPKTPAGLPVSVCVWWSGSHNLLHYFLHKVSKNKPDVEPLPDVLCPNANEIVCSAVSRCTCFIALGLSSALVCIWDRRSGSPLSVVSVLAAESVFSRLQFVDYWPLSADDSQTFTTEEIHLMVVCKNGVIHAVTTGRGTESCTMQLTERPEDSGDLPTITASVSFLQGLSLVVQRNGKMFLQDVVNKTTVCFLIPPTTHLLATPCNPVYALSAKQHALFIRGDQDPSCSASAKGECQSQLFIFHFGKPDIMKQYNVSFPDSPQQQNALNFDTLEDSCNLYLQQRALSVDERNKTITQTWKKLQETAKMVQQRHGS